MYNENYMELGCGILMPNRIPGQLGVTRLSAGMTITIEGKNPSRIKSFIL